MKKFILALLFTVGMTGIVEAQVPNNFAVVQQVFDTKQFDITTDDGQAAFVDTVICALNRVDSNWGNLRKNPGQTQVHGHAEDSVLYRSLGQSVDFIASSGTSLARPAWQPDMPRYSVTDWLPPHNCGTVAPPVVTPPTPTVDLSAVLAKLDSISTRLGAIEVMLGVIHEDTEATDDTLRNINSEVVSTAARVESVLLSNDRIVRQLLSPPEYSGRVAGMGLTLRPTVKPVDPEVK